VFSIGKSESLLFGKKGKENQKEMLFLSSSSVLIFLFFSSCIVNVVSSGNSILQWKNPWFFIAK
jgi:hypothetical protein